MRNNKDLHLLLSTKTGIGELSCGEGHESTWDPYTEKYFCLCIDDKFSKDSVVVKKAKTEFDSLVVDSFKMEKD